MQIHSEPHHDTPYLNYYDQSNVSIHWRYRIEISTRANRMSEWPMYELWIRSHTKRDELPFKERKALSSIMVAHIHCKMGHCGWKVKVKALVYINSYNNNCPLHLLHLIASSHCNDLISIVIEPFESPWVGSEVYTRRQVRVTRKYVNPNKT